MYCNACPKKKVRVESREKKKSPHTQQLTLSHKRVTWDFKFHVVDEANNVIVVVKADVANKAIETNKAKAMTDVAANKAHEADKADATKVNVDDGDNETNELNELNEANEAGIANAKANEADAEANEANEVNVTNKADEAEANKADEA